MRNKDDDALEMMFAQARATPPAVPEALMARVVADAVAAQPRQGWRAWLAGLGGLPGLGGLVTATCVGFWLGVAPPMGLPDVAGFMLGTEVLGTEVLGAEMFDEGDFTSPSLNGFGWDVDEG